MSMNKTLTWMFIITIVFSAIVAAFYAKYTDEKFRADVYREDLIAANKMLKKFRCFEGARLIDSRNPDQWTTCEHGQMMEMIKLNDDVAAVVCKCK